MRRSDGDNGIGRSELRTTARRRRTPPTATPFAAYGNAETTDARQPTATNTPEPSPTSRADELPRRYSRQSIGLVAVRDPFNGAFLFGTFQDAANYSCSNCHLTDSEKANLGPGLLNIKDRAATRVEGMSGRRIHLSVNRRFPVLHSRRLRPGANAAELGGDLQRSRDL